MTPTTALEKAALTARAAGFEYVLRPGETLEYIHRFCPRCGLDLTQEPHQAGDDQGDAEQVESGTDHAGAAPVADDLDADIAGHLQRMIAPLTEAEKERAERNEQRWLSRQEREQTTAGQQENSQPGRHEHLIPMLKRQFGEWVIHFRSLF